MPKKKSQKAATMGNDIIFGSKKIMLPFFYREDLCKTILLVKIYKKLQNIEQVVTLCAISWLYFTVGETTKTASEQT